MASLMDDLIAVMEQEAICYENYLKTANNKKEVIIKGDVPGLQQITQEEEIVAGQLFRLEKKRQAVVSDICTVTNRNAETFTVSALVRDLAARPEESERLKIVADRLSKALEACRQINQTNKMLIEQSLEFLEFTINAFSGLAAAGSSPTYRKKQGDFKEPGSGHSIFDAKQ
ncbi:hypothetical protein C3V36_05430 [Lachnospiraceae bacterium oral taxon 500]|nr:hypothetical protein C3V36_05430 [Lachnospiraceae bacterium oral taxon 500]